MPANPDVEAWADLVLSQYEKHAELTRGDMAAMTGLTDQQIKSALKSLQQRGFLTCEEVKQTGVWRRA